jgi:broad specificity phosphatase PhoE
MMTPALLAGGKVVTGGNHGEAFGKLSETEKNLEILSGFIENCKFITDQSVFYLKQFLLIRHGHSEGFTNSGLTPIGRSQGQFIAHSLKGFNGVPVFCSPYIRCLETGRFLSPAPQLCPQLAKRGDQETEISFVKRLTDFLDCAPEKSLVITHCDVIVTLVKLTTKVDVAAGIPNCATTFINQCKLIWHAKECDHD